jgi:hypothetical protein
MQASGFLQRLARRDLPLAAIVGFAIVNGLPLTSLFDSVAYILYLFTRGSAFLDQALLEYLASIFITGMTLLLAGVPAALYERVRGLQQSTPVSLGIWLVAAALLALPALASIARP